MCARWTWRRRIGESSDAVTNVSPAAATATAVGPGLAPGNQREKRYRQCVGEGCQRC
jgi:hypothetical protein